MPYKTDKTKGIMKSLPILNNAINRKSQRLRNYLLCIRKKVLVFFIFILVIHPLVIAQTTNLDTLLTPEEIVWLNNNKHNIRYAPNPSWVPGDYVEDGVHKGIVSDYIKIFEQKLGVTFQRVYYQSWTEIIEGLKNSEIDFVGAIQQTTERDAYLYFTQPFHKSTLGIIVRTNYEHPLTNEHIGTMKLACIENYTSTEYVRQQFPNVEIIEYNFDFSALMSTSYAETDGAVIDFMTASHLVEMHGITNLKFAKKLDFVWNLRVASIKQKPMLASILDKLLSTVTEDQRKEIASRWVRFDIVDEPTFYERNKMLVWGAALILVSFILLAIIINLYLNKQIHIKTIELVTAKEKAEESDKLKSAFLANMSHEIRTPMNGILGFADLLKEPHLSDEKQQKYIQIIEKSSARMLNIINDIVSISKIESGTVEIHYTETNINNQLQFVYETLKLDAEKKNLNLSFTYALPEKEAMIKTDSAKFYGILTNLVKNAIKYTDKGTIEFGYACKAKEFEFYIKDTGIGIPKDMCDAIFERFIQADITDKMARQGAGLGLAISRAYVEMLSGRIWVVSEEGKGSTFFFTLPGNMDAERKTTTPDKSGNEEKPLIPENLGLKILVAEDDEASTMLISIKLEKFSREILKVTTGKEAIEACRTNPDIDLVLMDIQMPEINGYRATSEIRKFNKKVIIIAQTAFALAGDREKAIEAGCNDYITKPIKHAELLILIQTYFKK